MPKRDGPKVGAQSRGGLSPETTHKLDEFFVAVQRAPLSLLLLDYDGSMARFRVDASKARPFAGVPELLGRIQSLGRTRMAVVTGRPAAAIWPLLALDSPIEVWGLHGAERLYPDGRREVEGASATAIERLKEVRAQLARDSFGGRFEDKANAAVMHWRGLPRQKAQLIEKKTRALFDPLARLDGLRLLDFEAGVELRVGRDKGGAVDAILEESAPEAPVAYLGDDLTDEAAFRAVNASGRPGMSVLMRPAWRETAAAIWLRPPNGLRMFLRRWISAQER